MLNFSEEDYQNEIQFFDALKSKGALQSYSHLNDEDQGSRFDARAVTKNGHRVWIELKTRPTHSWEAIRYWGGPFINADKFWSCVKIARREQEKALFAVWTKKDREVNVCVMYDPKDDSVLGQRGDISMQATRWNGGSWQESSFAYKLAPNLFEKIVEI